MTDSQLIEQAQMHHDHLRSRGTHVAPSTIAGALVDRFHVDQATATKAATAAIAKLPPTLRGQILLDAANAPAAELRDVARELERIAASGAPGCGAYREQARLLHDAAKDRK